MIRAVLIRRESALLLALILMFIGFAVFVDGFFDWFNLFERSRYWVVPGMIAVPMTFIIATSGIDLSVGSMVALAGIVLGLLYQDAGVPLVFAAIGAVVAGGAAGAFNGGVSSYLRVPPLVVTLATMALFRGIAMGLSQANPIRDIPRGFQWISQGDAFQIPLGASEFAYIPVPLFALAFTTIAGILILRRTWIGRFTECIGENETAAEFAAINTRRLKFWLYAACGLVCGLAALFQTALYATAKADTAMGLELEVIACVVVGGTRISGGYASVFGTLLGLLIIGILRYGLDMAGVNSENIVIVLGTLLIVTAVFNEWMAGRTGGKA
jgi:rhamnose transport system permease protein